MRRQEMTTENNILSLQFGNCYQRKAAGYTLLSRIYTNPCYLWATRVSEWASLNVDDPLLEGYIKSMEPAEFWIGLPRGSYTISITCYDPIKCHGPFAIFADDSKVLSDCRVHANVIVEKSFECEVSESPLKLTFVPEDGADFVISALTVYGTPGVELQPIFQTSSPVTMPSKVELLAHSDNNSQEALRTVCDWLLDHRSDDGFLGDAYDGGVIVWYTASMPIRALLAGYDILGDVRYRDTAFAILDIFVGEQLPNGGFTWDYRGIPTSELSDSEIERVSATCRLPMSDIGSVVSALAIGSAYADSPRKEQYVASVLHFCDDWASRFQLRSGAFTDGTDIGGADTGVYSCATAIEASVFSLAHAISGEERYLAVARDAIRFLLPDWLDDGRTIGRCTTHWFMRNRLPFVMEPLYFGDQWYYDEGFITTALHAQDENLRRDIIDAIRRRVFGTCGLLAALDGKVWWPVQDIWNNAKSLGMVQTLLSAKQSGMTSPGLEDALECMNAVLCTPEYSVRLGTMANDDERPASVHLNRTWSGTGIEATGFAGMTIAEMIKPGVLYLAVSRETC